MAWIEDLTKRSQKVKHFYDSSTNKWKAEITIHDQHYKDESDIWQDVNENFEDDVGNFDKRCTKTRHAVHISNSGNRRWYPRCNVLTEYVDIIGMEYWTGNQWRNLNLPNPVWTNNKSEWDMTHLYISLINIWGRLKADFILKDNLAPTGLRYQLIFVGLIYNHTTGELTSTTDGLVWGYISKPTGVDANELPVNISDTYDGNYITWMVNTVGATYPINVDPTFTDGYGGDVDTHHDCFTYLGTPNTATGSDVRLGVRLGSSYDRTSLLRFNLTSMPGGVTISNATLYLFNQITYASDIVHTCSSILSANSSWDESVSTWNYRVPSTERWAGDSAGDGGADAGCSQSGVDFNSTALGTFTYIGGTAANTQHTISLLVSQITDWYNGSNYGMCIRMAVDTSFYWNSSNATTTNYRPKLVIEYTLSGENVDESISLGKVIRVSQPFPETIDESISLNKTFGITSAVNLALEESISLTKAVGQSGAELENLNEVITQTRSDTITALSQTNEKDGLSLVRSDTITALSQTNEKDGLSLARSNTITAINQTNEKDGLSLARYNTITALSQTNEKDGLSLARSIGLTVLEDTFGEKNENVPLNHSLGLNISEHQSIVNEGILLIRINGISSQNQVKVNDNVILNPSFGLTIFEHQSVVNDNATLTRTNALTSQNKIIIDHNLILSKFVGLTFFEHQSVINDILSLSKFIRITISEETRGQYSESLILERVLALSILQEGISHVGENIIISKFNGINISEQNKLYNTILLNRSNGITLSSQCQIFNTLSFTRSNGIGIIAQIQFNENITANRINGINTNSQLILNEIINLSQLDGLSIFDSRYLLENILLEYTKGLLLDSSPSIIENINLGRINSISLMTILIVFNNINLGRFNLIIGEPPSLYVYNDGNHSVEVLFRDKRLGVPFRDKRVSVPWRDKRTNK